MDCTGKLVSVTQNWLDNKLRLMFEIEETPTDEINDLLKMDKLAINVKKWRKKRSLDSNAYCWLLCTKIANHPQIMSSKEEVYEDMIQKFPLPYEDEDGYIIITVTSKVDMSKVDGHWAYYATSEDGKFKSYIMLRGSSDFDSSEMARFIDLIVSEAKGLGIETLPPDELERMVSLWKA